MTVGAPALPGGTFEHRRARVAARRELDYTEGNRIDVLLDGPDTHAAMFAAIEQARDHINIESYIIEADGPGEELARRLAERCRAGVRVNLLYDGVGSLMTSASYFHALRDAGVHLCEYNAPRALNRLLHLRDHRKLMIVDGRVGFIGGVNISRVYSFGSSPLRRRAAGPPGWRDTHLRVTGPVVHDLQRLYTSHWKRHSEEPLGQADYFPPVVQAGPQRAALAASDAGRRPNPYYRALLAALDSARRSVCITTAYLVPTRRLMRALTGAAARGVDVQMLLPGFSDFWAPLYAGRSHYEALLRAGVRLHELHDTMLHAKTCVIDGLWTSVGSSNLDWRSVLHNAEANLVVHDRALAARMEQVFRDDVERARAVDLQQWRRRGWLQRGLEATARRFEFFL